MEENELTATEHHFNLGEEVEIDGKKVVVKSLGTKAYPYYIKVQKCMRKNKVDLKDELSVLNALDGEGIEALSKMIAMTIEQTYPDETREYKDYVATAYFDIWMYVCLKANSPRRGTNNATRKELISQFQNLKKNESTSKSKE